MQKFIRLKLVIAVAMTRLAYNDYRGWQLPENEDGADDGYLVESLGGGKSNHPDHVGYINWLPKEQFESDYNSTDGMIFGFAIEALKRGERVARAGWNGKGMWLGLVESYDYNPDKGRAAVYALGCQKLPWIGMKTADEKFVPWLASQTDMLAEDWVIVE